MVQIRVSPDKKEIEIKMPVFYLYEIIDNDEWLSAVLEKCKVLIIEELEKAGLNKDQGERSDKGKGESTQNDDNDGEGGDEGIRPKPR